MAIEVLAPCTTFGEHQMLTRMGFELYATTVNLGGEHRVKTRAGN
jgi:hypothetical protein